MIIDRGTVYGCDAFGDKESAFFPQITGKVGYGTRL